MYNSRLLASFDGNNNDDKDDDGDDSINCNNNIVEESWDDDVDYDKLWKDPSAMDILPTSAWDDTPQPPLTKDNDNTMTLGFSNDVLSDLLDAETAAQLKEDAKFIVEAKKYYGFAQFEKGKNQLAYYASSRGLSKAVYLAPALPTASGGRE